MVIQAPNLKKKINSASSVKNFEYYETISSTKVKYTEVDLQTIYTDEMVMSFFKTFKLEKSLRYTHVFTQRDFDIDQIQKY